MLTPQTLIRHELIGLPVRIVESTNRAIVGVEGKVVDETRNTLSIESDRMLRVFIKEQCVFLFTLPSGERVKVDGVLLVGRPEDRIKKKVKKW